MWTASRGLKKRMVLLTSEFSIKSTVQIPRERSCIPAERRNFVWPPFFHGAERDISAPRSWNTTSVTSCAQRRSAGMQRRSQLEYSGPRSWNAAVPAAGMQRRSQLER